MYYFALSDKKNALLLYSIILQCFKIKFNHEKKKYILSPSQKIIIVSDFFTLSSNSLLINLLWYLPFLFKRQEEIVMMSAVFNP